MSFETKVVRQFIPTSSASPSTSPASPGSVLELIQPDDSGGWRYREMIMLEPSQYDPGYTVTPDLGYTVPGKSTVSPYEALVIWERYKENE
jgi:hypothetical protein